MLSEFYYIYSYRAQVLQSHSFCVWVLRAFNYLQDCGLIPVLPDWLLNLLSKGVLGVSSRRCRQIFILLLSRQKTGTKSCLCHGSRWNKSGGRKKWGRILQNQFCWFHCLHREGGTVTLPGAPVSVILNTLFLTPPTSSHSSVPSPVVAMTRGSLDS